MKAVEKGLPPKTHLLLVAEIRDLAAAAYVPFALVGAFVIHMTMRPARRDIAAVAGAALGFAVVSLLHRGAPPDYFGRDIGVPGAFLGLGSMLVLASQWIWAPSGAKWSS